MVKFCNPSRGTKLIRFKGAQYSFRVDPAPYTGKSRNRHLKGRKVGQYAREALSYQEIPSRDRWISRYVKYIDSWGYYDTKYTQYWKQPTRDWKRTKVKRQYMKHKEVDNFPHRVLNREYGENYPFCTVTLSKELYDKTSTRLRGVYGAFRFFPENPDKYEGKITYDWGQPSQEDMEFTCPKCGNYNKQKMYTEYRCEYEPFCEYCHTYIIFGE